MATKGKYTYSIEMQDPATGRWARHPWTIDGPSRPDANHGLHMLQVNQAPLESMGLYGPLRIARYPALPQ